LREAKARLSNQRQDFRAGYDFNLTLVGTLTMVRGLKP